MDQQLSPEAGLFRTVFDASPTAMLVVDENVAVQDYNRTASLLLGGHDQPVLKRRGGEVLHCLHAFTTPEGCGRSPGCGSCVVLQTVKQALAGDQIFRRSASMEILEGDKRILSTFMVSASPFDYQDKRLVLLGLEDITEVIALRKLLPICSSCKRIRDDDNYWVGVEMYFERYLGADFSHGICPDCAKKLYPQIMEED